MRDCGLTHMGTLQGWLTLTLCMDHYAVNKLHIHNVLRFLRSTNQPLSCRKKLADAQRMSTPIKVQIEI